MHLAVSRGWPERLGPFPCEAFGGSTGIIDVGGPEACDQASHPEEEPIPRAVEGGRRCRPDDRSERPLQTRPHCRDRGPPRARTPAPRTCQTTPGGSCEWSTAPRTVPQRPPVEGRILGEAAGDRVEITVIGSLKRPAHKLNEVGGRGFLSHPLRSSRCEAIGGSSGRVDAGVVGIRTPTRQELQP